MRACVLGCVLVTALGVSGAGAQLSVHLVFDRTEVMVGETIEATLVATISAPEGSYFSSISANLIASDASLGLASTMTGLDWGMPALGSVQSGTPDGANLMGIFAAQQSLFGAVDTSSPFVIGQFTITALAEGQLTYISTPANAAPGSFSSTYNSPFPPLHTPTPCLPTRCPSAPFPRRRQSGCSGLPYSWAVDGGVLFEKLVLELRRFSMKQPVVVCGVVSALMVPTALAQSNRVDLVFDRTEVMVGETVEATLVATLSGFISGMYFSSISANLIASDASLGLASTMSGLDWGMPALGAVEAGTPNGASLMGIFAAQQSLFGPVDFSNPFVIGRFTVETTGPGQLTYSVTRAYSAPGAFSFSANCGPIDCHPNFYTFASQTITIRPVPAPATLVVLGILPISRRRRRSGLCWVRR